MKKKYLYYTILTFAFIVLFALDVFILASLNVKSEIFIGFGAAIVLSIFGIFKFFLKEHHYFKDLKGESNSCGRDDEVSPNNSANTSQVEEPVQIDEDIPTPKIINNNSAKDNPVVGIDGDCAGVPSIIGHFVRWNAKYYISINTVILIALIAFLYILPVYDGESISEYSWSSGGTSRDMGRGDMKIIPFERHDLLIYNFAVFFLAAIGLVMNWGHNIVKDKRSWLYLFNIAVQVLISMMYILAYLKWRSDYWPFLFCPISCSLYICMVSNRLMKETNQ